MPRNESGPTPDEYEPLRKIVREAHQDMCEDFAAEDAVLLMRLLDERDALLSRVTALEQALAVATTPNILGLNDGIYYAEDDYCGLDEDVHVGDVLKLDWANRVLDGEWWAANVPLSCDGDGDVDESEIQIFRSEAEARAAIARLSSSGEDDTNG